jgi:hypothetical protein
MKNKRILAVAGLPILAISLFVFVPKIWGHAFGRMTGGGSIFLGPNDFVQGLDVATGTRITHGFELHCGQLEQTPDEPNNLQIDIHTPDGGGGRFHLEQLTASLCFSSDEINPRPPDAPFYAYEGDGTGRFNGQPGYCAQWRFTDQGEPGVADRIAWLSIWDCDGALVVQVVPDGHPLTFGNHQAHRAPGRP